MIPTDFDYKRASSVDEAISELTKGGEDARLLAGGHSLVPLMKLRFAAPALLIDIRGISRLRHVNRHDGGWRIGALTTHADLQDREELGVVARATSLIADQQVRNRGTVGGSVAHGDPASDMPTVLLAAEGSVTAQGPGGERVIPAAEMFVDYMETALAPDEVITSVSIPSLDGYGWGYEKFNRRSEDWAMVGVCALVKASGGTCEDVRIGLTHMGSTPLRASAAEDLLRGEPLTDATIASAADAADDGTEPSGDANATPDYKRHLSHVLTRRALTQAAGLTG